MSGMRAFNRSERSRGRGLRRRSLALPHHDLDRAGCIGDRQRCEARLVAVGLRGDGTVAGELHPPGTDMPHARRSAEPVQRQRGAI